MGKYIPPERMTEAQIREEVNREFRRWYSLLREKMSAPVQLSLFAACDPMGGERPIPPKVHDRYMVRDGEYPNRLSEAVWPNLVWGRKGEYHA